MGKADLVYDEGGNAINAIGCTQDISERKREAEEKEKIVAHSPVPMVVVDAQGDIIFFNKKFTKQYGDTIADISTEEEWWENVYPDIVCRQEVQSGWEKAVTRATDTGEEIETQVWDMTCKKGLKHTV